MQSRIVPMEGTLKSEQSCPACEQANCDELKKYGHEQWRIVRCSDCNFVYLKNPPGYAAMVDEFAWEKTSKTETSRRLKKRPVMARLSRKSRWRLGFGGRSFDKVGSYFPSGKILDIGCGAGNLKFGENIIPFGIEISRSLHAVSDAKMKKSGGYVVHAPAIDGVKQFEDEFFDGVVMFSYLEHEQCPLEVLKQVSRILKPGGRAYVRVPNFGSINRMVMGRNWCGFRYPDHTNYFTTRSLKHMAAGAGLGYLGINTFSSVFDDNITALLPKQ